MLVRGLRGPEIELARPLLSQCTEDGRYTVDDLIEQIKSGDRQCWMIDNRAIALTQISAERFKTCWITHVTGAGLQEWKDAFEEIEAWARYLGCARIEAVARPGYERIGKQYGLRKTHVLLVKELTDGQ